MKQEHKDYLEEHINNWHTVENGYVRNIDINILNMYQHIYRENLDAQFQLTAWCSSCVMDMIYRLYKYYFSLPQEEVQQLTHQIVIKKRGRPKK